jgi:hypothetical protein
MTLIRRFVWSSTDRLPDELGLVCDGPPLACADEQIFLPIGDAGWRMMEVCYERF